MTYLRSNFTNQKQPCQPTEMQPNLGPARVLAVGINLTGMSKSKRSWGLQKNVCHRFVLNQEEFMTSNVQKRSLNFEEKKPPSMLPLFLHIAPDGIRMSGNRQSQPRDPLNRCWDWRTTLAVLQLNPGKIYMCLMKNSFGGRHHSQNGTPVWKKKRSPGHLGGKPNKEKHMNGYREILHHKSEHSRTAFGFPNNQKTKKCLDTSVLHFHRHSHKGALSKKVKFFGGHRSQNGALQKTVIGLLQTLWGS